jgi:hypothetical protein
MPVFEPNAIWPGAASEAARSSGSIAAKIDA